MTVELLQKKFPPGTRIKMIEHRNGEKEFFGVKPGDRGTVKEIDPFFKTIIVDWDNGSNLDLVFGSDRFSIVT